MVANSWPDSHKVKEEAHIGETGLTAEQERLLIEALLRILKKPAALAKPIAYEVLEKLGRLEDDEPAASC